jgi:tetratricopeptide (TPR) repeat protein
VRAPIALVAGCLLMAQAASVSPDDLIARGRASYDAGRYADAVKDLSAAADAIVTPQQMQQYVSGGKFDALPKFETALIYLAMSYAKLGRDGDAREQIQRLVAAETIAPAYATLAIPEGFEDLVRRVSPSTALPMHTTAPLQVAQPVQPAQQIQPAQPAQQIQPAQPTSLTADQQRELEQRIAAARAEFEKELDQKIAAMKADMEREAERRIAAERAAVERQTQEQIAAIRAAGAQATTKAAVPTVRRAEGMAIAGDLEDANAMYARLLSTPNPSRDLIAAVATGFYRTGDFPGALRAFDRLGTFARGEEDLRYYKAVALYETGRYAESKKELECALPFIERTDEVDRYREKIEQVR